MCASISIAQGHLCRRAQGCLVRQVTTQQTNKATLQQTSNPKDKLIVNRTKKSTKIQQQINRKSIKIMRSQSKSTKIGLNWFAGSSWWNLGANLPPRGTKTSKKGPRQSEGTPDFGARVGPKIQPSWTKGLHIGGSRCHLGSKLGVAGDVGRKLGALGPS